MSFVDETIYTSHGIERGFVGRLVGFLLSFALEHGRMGGGGGGPWFGGCGGLFMVEFGCRVLLRGGVSRPGDPASHQSGRVFLVLNASSVGCVAILSQNK